MKTALQNPASMAWLVGLLLVPRMMAAAEVSGEGLDDDDDDDESEKETDDEALSFVRCSEQEDLRVLMDWEGTPHEELWGRDEADHLRPLRAR